LMLLVNTAKIVLASLMATWLPQVLSYLSVDRNILLKRPFGAFFFVQTLK